MDLILYLSGLSTLNELEWYFIKESRLNSKTYIADVFILKKASYSPPQATLETEQLMLSTGSLPMELKSPQNSTIRQKKR